MISRSIGEEAESWVSLPGEVDDMKVRVIAKAQAADVDEDDVRTEEFASY
jgi:hypothetical protein